MDGELFAHDTLITKFAMIYISVEPTAAYTSSQNGKAEIFSIKVAN